MDGEKVERANQLMGDRSLRLRSDGDDAPPWASCFSEEERGDADMLSRLGMLFFIVLPVVVPPNPRVPLARKSIGLDLDSP
jgi:hypothetical protein